MWSGLPVTQGDPNILASEILDVAFPPKHRFKPLWILAAPRNFLD